MSDPLLHDKLRIMMAGGRGSEAADVLLNECDKDSGECMECSVICCPHGEPLHFHHDGCPACEGGGGREYCNLCDDPACDGDHPG